MPVKKSKSTKRRTRVKDLPQKKRELSKEEQKKVKGGAKPQQEVPHLIRIIE